MFFFYVFTYSFIFIIILITHLCLFLFPQKELLAARSEGGCPFIHFDDQYLEQTLVDLKINPESGFHSIRKTQPMTACQFYLASKLPQDICANRFLSPVQFYKTLRSNAKPGKHDQL